MYTANAQTNQTLAAEYLLGAMDGESSNYNLADLAHSAHILDFVVADGTDVSALKMLIGTDKKAALKALDAIVKDAQKLAERLTNVIGELECLEVAE